MDSILSYEEMKLWRSSTEKITLEEFAKKLGKKICGEKDSQDLYDIVKTQKPKEVSQATPMPEVAFKKELTGREKIVFTYLSQNKGRVVYVKEIAKILNLPNDYVYKYIKNIREKLEIDTLENAEKGGYVLH